MIWRNGRPVPGFALGDFQSALRVVMGEIENFTRSLSPHEQTILRLGLEASHLEESVVHGDWKRAEAHAESVANLLNRMKRPFP